MRMLSLGGAPSCGIFCVKSVIQCASAHAGSSSRPSRRIAPAAMRVAVTTLWGGGPVGGPAGGTPGAGLWTAAASGAAVSRHHVARIRPVTAGLSGRRFKYGMLLGDVRLQPREVTPVLVVRLPQRFRRRPSHLGIAVVQGSREPGDRGRSFHLAQPL